MRKITAIEAQKKRSNRVNIYLDGEFAFGLERITAAWLRVGQALAQRRVGIQDPCQEFMREDLFVGQRLAQVADAIGIDGVVFGNFSKRPTLPPARCGWRVLQQFLCGVFFRVYLRENLGERDYDKRERTFHVLLEEVPAEMLEAFATGRGVVADALAGGDFGANFSLGMARFSDGGEFGAFFSHGLADFSAHLGAFFSHGLADFSPPFGANFRVKTLKPLNQTLKTPPTQPAADAEENAAKKPLEDAPAETGGRVGWSFSDIAKNNAVNASGVRDLRKALPDEQVRARKFLAWILYAYSPLGKGLTDATGVSVVVKKLRASEPEFAPQKFERLVKLGPQKLRELFDRDYAREDLGKSVEAQIYRANVKKLDPERKSELYFALFGMDAPEPAAKQPVARQKTALQIRLEELKARKALEKDTASPGQTGN